MRFFTKIKLFFKNLFSKPKKQVIKHSDPDYYKIALAELGQAEIKGRKHNPRIIEYHLQTSLEASDDETPWCAAFVNWCLSQAKLEGTKKANARSFMNLGVPARIPMKGDIVVLWRGKKNGWQGHVGFFVDKNKDSVLILGGNQDNKVCFKWYPNYRVLGYRRVIY